MSERMVALIRGINVGRTKRVAMADLRELVAELGYSDVRTLLNSGNAVFTDPGGDPENAALRIAAAIASRCAVSARVTVLTATELAAIVRANPLLEMGDDPSRLLVAVLADSAEQTRLEPLLEREWTPECLALGDRVAYLWCPGGVLKSRLPAEIERLVGDAVTTRNWRTITKLHALAYE